MRLLLLCNHGLTCKGTLRQVFIRVYRLRYSQSCWYFRPSFVSYCPSNHLSLFHLPPPFSVSKYRQWVDGRGWGCWVVLETIFCRFWPDSEPTKLLDHPQTDKHLPQSPFTGKFFRWRHFALFSISLIFLRVVAIRCGEPEDIMNGLLERKCQTFGCRISYACEPGYELHGNSHRWAPYSKSFEKKMLRGNSTGTKFAATHKQEIEF
jgi:hypothetical protein